MIRLMDTIINGVEIDCLSGKERHGDFRAFGGGLTGPIPATDFPLESGNSFNPHLTSSERLVRRSN